jgi:hypothetical protein
VVEDWSPDDLAQLTTLLNRMVDTWAERAPQEPTEVHAARVRSRDPWWSGS